MAHSKELKDVFNYNSLVHAISGSVGSIVAMSAFYPFDTVRSRLQLGEIKNTKNESTFQLILSLLNNEGVESLYRGIQTVLQSVLISNFVYFYTFHTLKALRSKGANATVGADLILGALAGVVNVLSTTPFWVVNTRLKMGGNPLVKTPFTLPYDNMVDGLKHIFYTEGVSGLWSGTMPSLMLVSNPAIQFACYEAIKRNLVKVYGQQLPAISYFFIGALAKSISTVLTYPLQLIQTKLRHGDNLPPKAGVLDMLFYILKKKGVAGLYVGLNAKLWQTVLTASFMFYTYEKIRRFVMSLLLRNKLN